MTNVPSFPFSIEDLRSAIDFLDGHSLCFGWQLSRITNTKHALPPVGEGLGITLFYWGKRVKFLQIWEKAGGTVTVSEAAHRAVARLEEAIQEAVKNE
jgi:hypothetical protein